MNKSNSIQELLGATDIYLLDQIMKGRYQFGHKILDAGCGMGRNLHWFIKNEMDIVGVDGDADCIYKLRTGYSFLPPDYFQVAAVESMPFADNYFDHVISSAVLHFADSTEHFKQMMAEMVRVLKPGGSLFIRMTSDIGIEKKITHLGKGIYLIPDGSEQFLLNKTLLADVMKQNRLSFLEPFKTVNVDDLRCMSTIVLQKK
jgi:tellurite methyltransferase